MTRHDILVPGVLTVKPPAGFIAARAQLGEVVHESYTYTIDRVNFDAVPGGRVCYFIKNLTERGKFAYLGQLDPLTGEVVLTGKSSFPATATRVRTIKMVAKYVWLNRSFQLETDGWVIEKTEATAEVTAA